VGLLAGCSAMPAFGPDADAITGKGADRTAVVKDAVPFEIVEVKISAFLMENYYKDYN
jgi:polysaccharide export outer membrane protein